jgi:hypothetical protein
LNFCVAILASLPTTFSTTWRRNGAVVPITSASSRQILLAATSASSHFIRAFTCFTHSGTLRAWPLSKSALPVSLILALCAHGRSQTGRRLINLPQSDSKGNADSVYGTRTRASEAGGRREGGRERVELGQEANMEGSSWMSVAIRCVANCMRAEYGWSVRSYGGIVAPCTCERDRQTPFNLKMQMPPRQQRSANLRKTSADLRAADCQTQICGPAAPREALPGGGARRLGGCWAKPHRQICASCRHHLHCHKLASRPPVRVLTPDLRGSARCRPFLHQRARRWRDWLC